MSENKIYIEKSKVLKAVEALRPTRLFYDSEIEFKAAMRIFNAVKNRIGHAKSARAADLALEVHGEWCGSVCSACGESTSFWYDCNYCPHCGAEMSESEKSGNE